MFEASIRQVMSYYMGFVRNGKGMDVALERLAFIGSQADKLSASNMHELMLAHGVPAPAPEFHPVHPVLARTPRKRAQHLPPQ